MTPKIHVYTAPADKFFVNSFLIEAPTGVILVDTQFLVSTAKAVAERIQALGKPLAGVVITHPHPDHFNGLPLILEACGAAPVYANAATIAGIAATQAAKREAWTPVYGDDYPTVDALPDHEVSSDAELEIAGLRLRLLEIGPGESADNAIVHLPDADVLIASDLIYAGCHPWLAEHRTSAWLDQLDAVESQFGGAKSVYPGHGPAGDRTLFSHIRGYIQDFRKLVAAHAENGALSEGARAAVVAETVKGREGWPLEGLVAMNADAVAQELAGAAG